ncbi:small GTP-binding protein domain [Edhazardia aedis USNM 41457]|uniref:Small GTP-binding protein domain n=1 Tax=Edhazardia aedis (strain USNM 41457) TaxID=1003232 RepID=J8ZYX5_EDHAE|nr:small GTP-binding protein domain [Edhazardia aedis USNM 41457]|eukprot:EJW04883.1 small GTP-binding protein domain [Edhazardia aedis USNM 41457]
MSILCQRLTKSMRQLYRKIFTKEVRILFFGLENSGKSTCISELFEETKKPRKSTNHIVISKYEKPKHTFICFDTPGKKENRYKVNRYVNKSNILVFCVDASPNATDYQEACDFLHDILYKNTWNRSPLLVLSTKNDVPNAHDARDIVIQLNLNSVGDREVACFSISALNGSNISEVYNWIVEQVDLLDDNGNSY